MIPCAACSRHLHETDRVCPFCAAEQRTEPSPVGALVLAAAMMLGTNACATDSVSAETTGSGSSEANTATATESGETDSSSQTTAGDTQDTASDSNDSSLSFYAGPDVDLPQIADCDPYEQDCPEGEKCVPYASTGGSWDANRCVPIMGNGQPGEPCNYGGVVTAIDDCGANSYCWDVMDVDGMPIGVCTEFCQGSPDEGLCPAGSSCLIANDGSITLCLPNCDPLIQDCSPGLGCYWSPFTSNFACIYTSEDLPVGDSCGFVNDCVPGTWCAATELLPSCNGSACCSAFCDLEAALCTVPDTECVAFFAQEDAPTGYETLGACVLPGA